MRMLVGLFTVLSVGALSQAMATDPPAEAPKTAISTSTPATAAPATTSTSPATADKATAASTDGTKQVKLVAADEAADARLKRLRAAGYRAEMHGKDLVFCRKEAVLGSRFEKKVCNSAEELDNQVATGRDFVETTQRNGLTGNPSGK